MEAELRHRRRVQQVAAVEYDRRRHSLFEERQIEIREFIPLGRDDQRFRAFDSRTGKEIWTTKLDYSAHATPITYHGKDGRQYVAVVATGGSYLASPAGGDSLMVYALPK